MCLVCSSSNSRALNVDPPNNANRFKSLLNFPGVPNPPPFHHLLSSPILPYHPTILPLITINLTTMPEPKANLTGFDIRVYRNAAGSPSHDPWKRA